MRRDWVEIIGIWAAVLALAIWLVFQPGASVSVLETYSGAVLAGALAAVSAIQLRSQRAEGFVRRLVYVAGGSYLILALASLFMFLRG